MEPIMKPYTHNFSVDETNDILCALRVAVRLANEIGTDDQKKQIKNVFELVGNREASGGYESQDERDAAYLNSFAVHQSLHGGD